MRRVDHVEIAQQRPDHGDLSCQVVFFRLPFQLIGGSIRADGEDGRAPGDEFGKRNAAVIQIYIQRRFPGSAEDIGAGGPPIGIALRAIDFLAPRRRVP